MLSTCLLSCVLLLVPVAGTPRPPSVCVILHCKQDPSTGYRLSCTSPALSMGLGPQPFAHCSVWLPDTSAAAAADSPAQQIRSSMRARAAAAAVAAEVSAAAGSESEPAAAPAEAAEAGSQPVGGDGSSSSLQQEREEAREGACSVEQQQQQQQPLVTWVILPDSTPEDVAQQLRDIGEWCVPGSLSAAVACQCMLCTVRMAVDPVCC